MNRRTIVISCLAIVSFSWPSLSDDCLHPLGSSPTHDGVTVKVIDGLAYVGGSGGLTILDIEDPAAIDEIGSVTLSSTPRNVFVSDAYAFVLVPSLQIIDVSDPVEPVQVGAYYVLDGMQVAVSESIAYIADGWGGLLVLDVSDPSQPAYVLRLPPPTVFVGAVTVSGNRLLVGDDDFLYVMDISIPSNPVPLGSVQVGPQPEGWIRDIDVDRDLAFVANWYGGFSVVDISDPMNPMEIGVIPALDRVVGVAFHRQFVYLSDDSSGLQVIDVSDPTSPSPITGENPGGTTKDAVTAGPYVYSVNTSYGIRIFEGCGAPVFADGFESGNADAW